MTTFTNFWFQGSEILFTLQNVWQDSQGDLKTGWLVLPSTPIPFSPGFWPQDVRIPNWKSYVYIEALQKIYNGDCIYYRTSSSTLQRYVSWTLNINPMVFKLAVIQKFHSGSSPQGKEVLNFHWAVYIHAPSSSAHKQPKGGRSLTLT